MGREVRRVPKGWQHPLGIDGKPIPLFNGYRKDLAEYIEGKAQWERGYRKNLATNGWIPREPDLTESYEWYYNERPDPSDYMPDFPDGTATHWMMYEDTSEGTPISPAFETPEELARWLADNHASAFGSFTASYDDWLATIKQGGCFSMSLKDGYLVDGVTAVGQSDRIREEK